VNSSATMARQPEVPNLIADFNAMLLDFLKARPMLQAAKSILHHSAARSKSASAS